MVSKRISLWLWLVRKILGVVPATAALKVEAATETTAILRRAGAHQEMMAGRVTLGCPVAAAVGAESAALLA